MHVRWRWMYSFQLWIKIAIFYLNTRWLFAIRGRPFDSEGWGGGWQILSGQILFSMSSAGKFIFRDTKVRIFIFTRNKILKRKNKNTKGKGGGLAFLYRWETGQDFPCDTCTCIYFCILLVCACTYSVYINGAMHVWISFDYLKIFIHSIIVSKTIVIEGGQGVLPQNFLK